MSKNNMANSDLEFTIKQASQAYKTFSEHFAKHRKTIIEYENNELWWKGYEKAVKELLEEHKDDFEYSNDVLEIRKKGNKISIFPIDRYNLATNKKDNFFNKLKRFLKL